ncbi:hypothetical protein [Megalodesulfovibrio gigas]|uniref:Uncharacterized protein n=1 Tax=Megalodesulfovibrio gigas (strain ATCC 19364 / DSM 1382 / NCIMB 9332 / VKM B-1759) TaxID=1121448 RepID=T2G8Q8_MEGG1|nr:hypothetical protein [Megalodesulfovibrio gigas]AGW12663.1 hypothetical protein DGI_0764 [Megalodesulfovibrio gigas DSM 1382 = ATCC 19364]
MKGALWLRGAVLAAMMVLMCAGAALAKQVIVMNGTTFEIHALALSPSESNDWGDDLLGNDILSPGEGLRINISGSANNWDLAAEDGEGTVVEFKNLDLRQVGTVTLHSDGTATLE